MDEAEIDRQWKLEKQQRMQDLRAYLRPIIKQAQTQQTAQNREQPDEKSIQENKEPTPEPLAKSSIGPER